jgi:site-specific DNA recombinase
MKVVQHLSRNGIRKPIFESRRGTQRGGDAYCKMDVIRILTDPVYIGKLRFQEEVFDGKHAPIVDLELFESVQAILRKNRECNGAYRDQTQHVFLLQGLIRCGGCGSYMTPKTSTGSGGTVHPGRGSEDFRQPHGDPEDCRAGE